MKPSQAVGFAAALTAIAAASTGVLELQMQSGSGGTHVAAALSPLTTVLWLPAVATVVLSWRLSTSEPSSANARWYRVLFALFVDAGVYMVFLFVPVCAVALLLEGTQTGERIWQFSRDYGRPSDLVLIVCSLFGGVAFWSSFGAPFFFGRGSPGSLAAGVVLKSEGGQSLWRTAFFGVFLYFGLAIPLLGFHARLAGFNVSARQRAA